MLKLIRSRLLLPLAFLMLALPAASFAGVFVSITLAPPLLPVYVQPVCPGEGYLWTPGYWAYGDYGYYWVPGTWVLAPVVGYLWTPGWWGWSGGFYAWHGGYWGPHVGFYGGVNYGYGYGGYGYEGGRWNNGVFNYNRSVNNVNVTNIHNTYNTTVINNTTVNRVSYNGGTGGLTAQPREQDRVAAREQHMQPTAEQLQHRTIAGSNRELRASVNHGRPAIAATPRPGVFSGRGVVAARSAVMHAPRDAARSSNFAPHSERSQDRLPSAGFAPHGNSRSEGNQPQRQERNTQRPQNFERQQQRQEPQQREAMPQREMPRREPPQREEFQQMQQRPVERAPVMREQGQRSQPQQRQVERGERGGSRGRPEDRR
ncbi:MAG: YXWGXW repeat-containing protein [Stenotrophobium sp.]